MKMNLKTCPSCGSPNISYDGEWIRRINPNTNEIILEEQTSDSIMDPMWNPCHECGFIFNHPNTGKGVMDSNRNIIVDKEVSVSDLLIQELFPTFLNFEQDLRKFIEEKMTQEYGETWKEYYEKLFEEPKRLARNDGEKDGVQINENKLMDYTIFNDCKQIIMGKKNWGKVFSPYFINKTHFATYFEEIRDIRNKLFHRREYLSDDEILTAKLNIKKIRKHMTKNII